MATRKTSTRQPPEGAPSAFQQPASTPQSYPVHEHSFTLQTVLELQKSVGELCSEVRLTREAVEKLDSRLDKIEERVSAVTHKLYAASVVMAILVAIGAFVMNKAWDAAAEHLAEVAKAAVRSSN